MLRYGSRRSCSSCSAPSGTRCCRRAWLAAIGKTMEQITPSRVASPLPVRDRVRRDPRHVLRAVVADRAAAGDDVRRRHATRRRGRRRLHLRANLALNYGFEWRSGHAVADQRASTRSSGSPLPGAIIGGWKRRAYGRQSEAQADDTSTSDATLTARLGACYTGAVHDVLRMMGHDASCCRRRSSRSRPGREARRSRVDGLRPHRPHEVASRVPARLVHAAVEGAARATSSCASRTTTRSR